MKFNINESFKFPDGGKIRIVSSFGVTREDMLKVDVWIGKLLSEMSWAEMKEEGMR